jgi:hypothetical protein
VSAESKYPRNVSWLLKIKITVRGTFVGKIRDAACARQGRNLRTDG